MCECNNITTLSIVGVSKRVIKRKFEVSLRSCDQSCDRLHKYTIDLFILLDEFHRTCSVNSETSVTTHTSIKFKYILLLHGFTSGNEDTSLTAPLVSGLVKLVTLGQLMDTKVL